MGPYRTVHKEGVFTIPFPCQTVPTQPAKEEETSPAPSIGVRSRCVHSRLYNAGSAVTKGMATTQSTKGRRRAGELKTEKVDLLFSGPLDKNKHFTLAVEGEPNCKGNFEISPELSFNFKFIVGLPS